jgi:hypothetical protein
MSKPLPSWASIIPGTNPPKPPPGGWALPNGATPGFLAVAVAMLEDAEMRAGPHGRERQRRDLGLALCDPLPHEEAAERERSEAKARQEAGR